MTHIGRVRVVFTGFSGAPGLATHYYHLDEAWNWAGYHQDLLDNVKSAYDSVAGLLFTGENYEVQGDIDIIEDTDGSLFSTIAGDAANDDGSDGSGFAPIPTGLCMTWRTNGIVNSKHVRGRTFLVPVGLGMIQADGTPATAALATAATFAENLRTALDPFGDMVVWSRPKWDDDHTEIVREGSSHFVTSTTIADRFAVLRSRRD